MRLLIDTHILIGLNPRAKPLPSWIRAAVWAGDNPSLASVASLWEIAIKTRLGKLDPGMPPVEIPGFLRTSGIDLLGIEPEHVLAELKTETATRDPFDRLLLAQCQVEDLRLVTLDRALAGHPLAWREN